MRILTRIFAIIGLMTVLGLLLSVGTSAWMASQEKPLPERIVLQFDFGQPIREVANVDPLKEIFGGQGVQMRSLVQALDRARKDHRVAGLIADLSRVDLSPAQIEEVRAALQRFTASGKFAYAWADSLGELGPGNRAYWLASAFSDIRMQPLGLLGLTGGSMSQPFLRDTLNMIGIIPDVHQRYEYKGAAANATESKLPEPLRENYQTLLNDIHANMVKDIATARSLKDDELRALIDKAPLLAEDAVNAKLIDRLGYADETRKDALGEAGPGSDVVDLMDYARLAPVPMAENARNVGMIYVTGPIVNRADDRGPMGENDVASAAELVKAVEDATAVPDLKVIIIRMDSPGGSVSASESIHHAIKQARAAGKYVIVSMADTAASGGYWIASAADYVIAQPSTITGSIGVVAGKLVIGPLSQRWGVNWSTLTTGANSGMWAPDQPFSGAGLARIEASLDQIYGAFTQRVAEGRKLTPEQVDKLARGRIWSGSHAKELGLVDELGGLREAFLVARRQMEVPEEQPVRIALFPAPETPQQRIIRLLQQFIVSPRLHPLSWDNMAPAIAALLHAPGTQASGAVYYAGPMRMD